jgi:hypothetical protein
MTTENKLDQKVMQKIQTGRVKMRPRHFFTLRSLGSQTFFALILLFSIFFLSVFLYLLNQKQLLKLVSFGSFGTLTFFESLPYPWLILSLITLIISSFVFLSLGQNYKKGWQKTWPILLVVLLLGATLLGFSGLTQKVKSLNNFYTYLENRGIKTRHVLVGKVYLNSPDGLVLLLNGQKYLVLYPPHLNFKNQDLKDRLVKLSGSFQSKRVFVPQNIQLFKKI